MRRDAPFTRASIISLKCRYDKPFQFDKRYCGRSNDPQFVTEQSHGHHNTNYQLNGAYQNLDPNTTIDFETPWGPLSSFKNTEETSSSEPASEPTAGEGAEGDGCDCACVEGLSPALTAIHTYEIWDDGGTPEFPDDDVLIGYAVTEFYGEPWGNTTIYDMDGNEVEPDENGEYPHQYNAQNSDWRLINAENFGTVVIALANGKHLAEPMVPEYQISQIASAITDIVTIFSNGSIPVGEGEVEGSGRFERWFGYWLGKETYQGARSKANEDLDAAFSMLDELNRKATLLSDKTIEITKRLEIANRIIIDFTPGVGAFIAAAEASDGEDFFNGKELSKLDRSLSAVSTAFAILPAGQLVARSAKQLSETAKNLRALETLLKNADQSDEIVELLKKTKNAREKVENTLECAERTKSNFILPTNWVSAKGVTGKFSDGKHTYRIDTNNLSLGERFHVHIYNKQGNEIAVIQGTGTNGVWRTSHRGKALLKPSDISDELLTDIRRLLRHALNNIH